MEEMILRQVDKYPQMEMQDVIKLIYQVEFGCEHIVKDAQSAARRLHAEMETLKSAVEGEPLYEVIGEGLCRLNLRPAREKLTEEEILHLFLSCAEKKRGTKEGFRDQLRQMMRLCDKGNIPFDAVDAEMFLAGYDIKKCPAINHSVTYHTLYKPAYRIVNQHALKELLRRKREG